LEYSRSVQTRPDHGGFPRATAADTQPPPREAVRESKVTVKIPRPLFLKIQQVVDGSGFNSPTDFIVYVLRDLMGEAEKHRPTPEATPEYTAEELEEVKRKLKNLGYL
jgi:hypothetical protein